MKLLRPFLAALLLSLGVCASARAQEAPRLPMKTAPALTEDQKTQLATAKDHTPEFDAPALYALLDNAHAWPRDAWAGVKPLDFKALSAKPETFRGEAFLIEGILVNVREWIPDANQLSRSGDPRWGSTLTEWAIHLGRDENKDPYVYVYFPSDGRTMPETRIGDRVKVAARFYKAYTAATTLLDRKRNPDPTLTGTMEDFHAFVGGPAEARRGSLLVVAASKYQNLILVVVFLVIAGGGLWFVKSYLRGMSKERSFKSPAERWEERRERERENRENEEDTEGEDLPEDPAEAMAELERRKKAEEGK